MLDKLLLNNQILASKSAVRKVKVNLINKQVQKIRKLKKWKEKYPDSKKIDGRILRIIEIVNCLKKSKCRDVLRTALLNEQDARKVLTNGLSTPEEIAEALYCSHKTIQLIVRKLKSILNIKETDRSWREQVFEPSKRKRKQLRTEKKQQIRQERKVRKELDLKRIEWMQGNQPEGIAESKKVSEDQANVDVKKSATHPVFTEDGEKPMIKTVNLKNDESKPRKVAKKVRLSKTELPESEEDEEVPAVQHAVDDFFLTASGDHYLSTVVIDRTQPERPDDGLVRKERRNMQTGNHRHAKSKRNFDNHGRRGKEINSGDTKGLITFESHSFGARKSNKFDANDSKVEKLHPSWVAKQKQKGNGAFEGTKVVFDDETNVGGKIMKQEAVNKEKLHPSWEAKQKLKPTIVEFTGKKVVFDD